jgi:hypothetical protein
MKLHSHQWQYTQQSGKNIGLKRPHQLRASRPCNSVTFVRYRCCSCSYSTVNECLFVYLCCFIAIVTCPQLNVSNSVLNTTDSNFTTAVQVVCDAGYAIDPLNLFNNSITTVCTSSGNWSTFPILCQRKSHRVIHWRELVRHKVARVEFWSVIWILLYD